MPSGPDVLSAAANEKLVGAEYVYSMLELVFVLVSFYSNAFSEEMSLID